MRIEFIDVLISKFTFIRVDKKLSYKTTYTSGDFGPNDIPNWQSISSSLTPPDPIIQAIPTNSAGHYDYTYDGSLGSNPTAVVQLRVSSPSAGWVTVANAKILDNGHIYADGIDFSMDQYQLLIKQ
jgi:hypothetical protein